MSDRRRNIIVIGNDPATARVVYYSLRLNDWRVSSSQDGILTIAAMHGSIKAIKLQCMGFGAEAAVRLVTAFADPPADGFVDLRNPSVSGE